ncbi:YneF family protein [Mycoplasma sp. CSL10137]|uniref:YneF family protein n=1 Tax=unclassified Mycoplasma TaxID=2683645 RepID=UPI00197B4069|nr:MULTISPECIES: YneF family protein [unclassified Mycoplasma]MBN4083261.1 YneF family protein [Mycoplasma sp. CSL10137]MBN4084438.1 YneF family protein [Mycoplasma sp. CSL10166]MBU4692923.1 YneF family protein [Mycoplasma sp. CSL7491-lung]MCU4706459.1 YneF family protein [Mycoplasma sp. CSL7503-lung]
MIELSGGALAGIIIGLIIGIGFAVGLTTFFLTKKMFEKQLKENPPINEKMIRIMFSQMGRKASETQIRQIMRSMQQQK